MSDLMKNNIELLAPAGSYESFLAAVHSGADAIYLGGSKFGARAFAGNFMEEEVLQAIDYAHLHGKKVFLTVNTLVKEDELQSQLFEYLKPLYLHGLDAIIVQDLGVLAFVLKHFPDLAIHASTQMAVESYLGAKFLEDCGVERVVLARELSVSEIKKIVDYTNLEIECFVHGALCYAYSGLCLYSGMIGGRSGNRGQCAQSCRLPYAIQDKKAYYMSMKDICTLKQIPELIEAGITSFKIEGRMKKPEYVAGVTAMYRKYIDSYVSGKENYHVLEEDINQLRDLFNRGDFHSGYYHKHNGKDMITMDKPNHIGVAVIKVLSQTDRIVRGSVLLDTNSGDVISLPNSEDDYTLGGDYHVGDTIELSLRRGVRIPKGTILYRTRNNRLIHEIQDSLKESKIQYPIEARLTAKMGEPIRLVITDGEFQVTCSGADVEAAKSAPIDLAKLENQMKKTGNTCFCFSNLVIEADSDIFIPMQQIKSLRREGIEQLEEKRKASHRRSLETVNFQDSSGKHNNIACSDWRPENRGLHVSVVTLEQLIEVREWEHVTRIYMECDIVDSPWDDLELKKSIDVTKKMGKEVYFGLPYIFRNDTISLYESKYQELCSLGCDGFLVRTLGQVEFLKQHQYLGGLMLDAQLYQYNNSSIEFWQDKNICDGTAPFELNRSELKVLKRERMEFFMYGHLPTMISAQCFVKTIGTCNHHSRTIELTDRKGERFSVRSSCVHCYNIVYSHKPICLFDEMSEVEELGFQSIRLSFTIESQKEVRNILKLYEKYLSGNFAEVDLQSFSKGHFRKGVS